MYRALYRKWRPKTFDEVVGQAHITSTLQRQVAEGKTAHAYLFTGTRGTGKTTCARILAKAVNCLHPVDGAPCCECEACRGIDSGSLLDVTELDAASNGKVDDARALREDAVYLPAALKKRVYIIDECHMLTKDAFNALLKILEEPPEHLMFILATTELHKVPATILSRCQRFSFKRILPQDMERQLLKIAKAEGIPLMPDGAELLSRMANGALRDALSLLDQCRVIDGTIDSTAVLQVLGLAGSAQTLQLMRCVLAQNCADALSLFAQLYRNGKDVAALLGELSDLARDLTILRAAPEGGAALLTGLYDTKTLSELGGKLPMKRFMYLTATMQACCASLPDSPRPRTEAEMCLLRLCDETLSGDLTGLDARVARLEAAMQAGIPVTAAPVASAPPTAVSRPTPVRQTADDRPPWEDVPPLPEEPPVPEEPGARVYDVPDPAPAPKAAPRRRSTAKAAPTAPVTGGDTAIWGQLIDQYKGRLPVNVRVFLNMVTGVLDGECLRVCCPDDFVKSSLDDPAARDVLQSVTEQAVGHPIRVLFTIGNDPVASGRPTTAAKRTAASPAQESPAPMQVSATASSLRDALDDLADKGRTLEHFLIKGE